MRRFWAISALSLACLLLPGSLSAQGRQGSPGLGDNRDAPTTYSSNGSILMLSVLGENKKPLDRQAVVKLSNETIHTAQWQTTADNSEADFGDLRIGKYDIEVSAVGYLTAHQELLVGSAINTYRVESTLKRDPAAVELNTPISPKMPSKARKETLRGVTALKSGNLKDAEKHLDAAHKVVPDSSEVSFLLGYLSYQKKDLKQAEIYLNTASTLDPHNVQALTLLGRLRLERDDFSAAKTVLEQAVTADDDSWMAHNLLADAYLKDHEFEKSREQARLAIEKSKGGGNAAQIVLGEALANLGRDKEAITALNTFLQYAPDSPSAQQVHSLITQLEQRDSELAENSATRPKIPPSLPSTRFEADDPLLGATDNGFTAKGWEPPGIDDVKPLVASDVACPYQQVIDGTGAAVKQFVDDVSRFNAIEDLLHENLNELGTPTSKETREFNYVVSISEPKPGFMKVDEFRTGRTDVGDFPDKIATRGLPALALIFHPDMRDNFEITCEGLGQWNGKATWILHFRQRDDRPNRIRAYRIGGVTYPVNLKGRAWVAADTYQIVRIESELVKPMRQIQLLSEHYTVDYGPVFFQKKSVELWLPQTAELYFHFQKHRYFRRHTFHDFLLFSVDSDEKTSEPKANNKVPDTPSKPNH
ncbi:MAG: tetratricopeptide repeat protein [Terriglobales bacterium]